MTIERVEFVFSDKTKVTFTPRIQPGGWVRWSAEVITTQDRREKRFLGERFSDDWITPTIGAATRLVRESTKRRAAEAAVRKLEDRAAAVSQA